MTYLYLIIIKNLHLFSIFIFVATFIQYAPYGENPLKCHLCDTMHLLWIGVHYDLGQKELTFCNIKISMKQILGHSSVISNNITFCDPPFCYFQGIFNCKCHKSFIRDSQSIIYIVSIKKNQSSNKSYQTCHKRLPSIPCTAPVLTHQHREEEEHEQDDRGRDPERAEAE